MANFKIGDKARFARLIEPADAGPSVLALVGRQVVITRIRPSSWIGGCWDYGARVDGDNGEKGFLADELEPLTPPHQKTITYADVLSLPNLEGRPAEFEIRAPG